MKNLQEPDTDIEIHISLSRDEAERLIDDMNQYGLSEVTRDLVYLLKGKLA